MIDRNRLDSALNRPNQRLTPRSLAKFLAFYLLFSSLGAALSESASARALWNPAQQPAQARRDSGAKVGDENAASLLEAGKVIKRELEGNQSHTYQIVLNSGQFLNLVIEQQGIDVVAQLSGPDGELIGEFNIERRSQGRELVPFVAEA